MNEETLKELRRNIIQRAKTIIDLTEKSNLAMTPQENIAHVARLENEAVFLRIVADHLGLCTAELYDSDKNELEENDHAKS